MFLRAHKLPHLSQGLLCPLLWHFHCEQSNDSPQEPCSCISSCLPFVLAVRCPAPWPYFSSYYITAGLNIFFGLWSKKLKKCFKYFLGGRFYNWGLQDIPSLGDGLFMQSCRKISLGQWQMQHSEILVDVKKFPGGLTSWRNNQYEMKTFSFLIAEQLV